MLKSKANYSLLLSAYKDFAIWMLKICTIIFMFAVVGFFISFILPNPEVVLNYDYFSRLAFHKMASFSGLYYSVSIYGFVFLFLTALLFIVSWLKNASMVGFIRDLLIVVFFGAFAIVIFTQISFGNNKDLLNAGNYDYFTMSALFTIYFSIAISNFGSVYEKSKEALKSLLFVLIFSAIASIPSLIEHSFSVDSVFQFFIYAAMVYVVSFMVKIMLHPETIVTVVLDAKTPARTDLKRLGFSFLMILVLIPLLGLGWSLLVLIIVFMLSLFFPISFSLNTSFMVLFSFIILPAAFIIYLTKHDFSGLFIFIIAVAKDVSFYQAKITTSDYDKGIYDSLDNNFLYKLIKGFSFHAGQKYTRTYTISSSIVIPLFAGLIFLSFMDEEKSFTEVQTLNKAEIFYDSPNHKLIFTNQSDSILVDEELKNRILKKSRDDKDYLENLVGNTASFNNKLIDSLALLNKIVSLNKLTDSVLFVYTNEERLYSISIKNNQLIDTVQISLPYSWPFDSPTMCISPDRKKIGFYTNKRIYLFNSGGRFIGEIDPKAEFKQVEFNEIGDKIAIGTETGKLMIYDMDGQLIFKAPLFRETIREIAFSPDEEKIAVGSTNADAVSCDLKTKKEIRFGHHSFKSEFYSFFKKSYNDIREIAYSKDGSLLLLQSDYLISLWYKNGEFVAKFNGHSGQIRQVSFSDDGKYIVSGAKDKLFLIRDYTGKLCYQVKLNQKYCSNFIFDDRKKLFIALYGNHAIDIYRLESMDLP
jgi:WD40 repeat protein